MRTKKSWLLGAIGIGLVASTLVLSDGLAASNNGNGNGNGNAYGQGNGNAYGQNKNDDQELLQELERLRASWDAQTAAVNSLQNRVNAQDQLIAQLRTEQTQQNLVIQSLQTTSADQLNKVQSLETKSVEQATAYTTLQTKSAAQDQLIQTLHTKSINQEQTIVGFQTQLQHATGLVEDYAVQLPLWQSKAEALQAKNVEQDDLINELYGRIANLNTQDHTAELANLNGQISTQAGVIEALKAKLAALEEKLVNLTPNTQLPTQPDPGTTPTQPDPGTTPTQPDPGTTPTQPDPGTTPTQPDPGTTPTQPDPGTTPTQPDPGTTPTQPDPGTTPTQPDPGVIPTQPTEKGIYEEGSALISYTGTWSDFSTPLTSGGGVKYSDAKGASFKIDFTGTALKVVGYKSRYMGIADIYLDGSKVGTIDYFSAQTLYKQVLFSATDLEFGKHTIEIVATGKKNDASLNSNINIDMIVIE
ncbi:hypothetical protein [Tumebacillus algifaecis]|uniref:hypothetical protein n=1 Tax=Tumebacillus algifaecis TaxID=1214604 RepID=UPI00187E0C46|nr:hypothetical protein [Tumebacillus algifaecis]